MNIERTLSVIYFIKIASYDFCIMSLTSFFLFNLEISVIKHFQVDSIKSKLDMKNIEFK